MRRSSVAASFGSAVVGSALLGSAVFVSWLAIGGLVQAQVAPATLPEGDLPDDPAFDRYVDLDLVAEAWENKDAALLTDLALSMAEGERILQRPRRGLAAADVFGGAIKTAAELKDSAALDRLASVLGNLKRDELVAQVSAARKLASASRAADPGLTVQADVGDPAAFFAIQSVLDDIASAKIAGDREALRDLANEIPELDDLSETQKRSLARAVTEALEVLPAGIDPSTGALNKLLDESRAGKGGGRSGGGGGARAGGGGARSGGGGAARAGGSAGRSGGGGEGARPGALSRAPSNPRPTINRNPTKIGGTGGIRGGTGGISGTGGIRGGTGGISGTGGIRGGTGGISGTGGIRGGTGGISGTGGIRGGTGGISGTGGIRGGTGGISGTGGIRGGTGGISGTGGIRGGTGGISGTGGIRGGTGGISGTGGIRGGTGGISGTGGIRGGTGGTGGTGIGGKGPGGVGTGGTGTGGKGPGGVGTGGTGKGGKGPGGIGTGGTGTGGKGPGGVGTGGTGKGGKGPGGVAGGPGKGPGRPPGGAGRGPGGRGPNPGVLINRYTRNIFNNLTYIAGRGGFMVGGRERVYFGSGLVLDPGDEIVYIGSYTCGNTRLGIGELIDYAIDEGEPSMVVRNGRTGELVTVSLEGYAGEDAGIDDDGGFIE